MTKKIYRQGDVLIIETAAKIPTDNPVPRENGRVILAHGEVTGHSHAISNRRATLYRDDGTGAGGRRFLTVAAGGTADLKHEEHNTIPLPPGNYEIRIQSEYHPADIRSVAD